MNEVLSAIHARRSTREFTSQQIAVRIWKPFWKPASGLPLAWASSYGIFLPFTMLINV